MSRSTGHVAPPMQAGVEILLVEDSAADAELTREALMTDGTDIRLHEVRDGVEALAFLRRGGRAHLTRAISLPVGVAIVGDDTRGDVVLRIDDGVGWTLVTFVSDAPAR